ncbi:MAG: hypothetical protein ACKPB0_15795 [Opitutaceae bacterium]
MPGEDRINRDRQAALNVLRPSARDLEHGLRLHAESLVFESNGAGLPGRGCSVR